MSGREVIGELVSVVKIDATQAAREAAEHARRLRGLKEAQDKVTQADKASADASAKLRRELIELRRVEVAGTGDKKALAKQAAEVRLRLQEQAEGAKALRSEQKALAAEQRDLQRAMRDTARVAKESAREQAEAAKLIARAEAQAHRERMNFRRLQASGAAINELTEGIEARDRRLHLVNNRFAGGARLRASEAVGRYRDSFGERAAEGLRGAPGRLAGLGSTALGVGVGAAGAVAGATAGIAARGAAFENLRASLTTVEGSAQKAAASFQLIQEFAAKTPFTVEQATTALTKLKSQGLDASLPALTAYGNTAAAMGKSLDVAIEAVADAAVGEFERLKEFGIKAKSEGDKVTFTFRGVSTTVNKESKAIEKYLIGIGETDFAGGMERQAQTLSGRMSTLGDAVSNLADQAFQGGLGQALKDVVADMTGAVEGGDGLAKAIGQRLGDAVRGTYAKVKEFIGPIDELPGKFTAAFDTLSELASTVASVAGTFASLAGSLDASTVAMGAFAIAAAKVGGPLGLAAAAGLGVGAKLGEAAYHAINDNPYQDAADEQARREREKGLYYARQAALRGEAELGQEQRRIESARAREEAAKAAGDRVARAELRALGVTTAAGAAALPASERERIKRMRAEAAASFDRPTLGGGGLEAQQARAGGFAEGRERLADQSELGRLNAAARRGKLSPSDQKRRLELSKTLDVALPGAGKKSKADLSAFEEERKREIDSLVKQAELDAADKALASGDAAGAAAAARAAGKSARDRLTAQSLQGALPGEVERSLLRQAGFDEAKSTPPPPIVAYFQTFNVEIDVPVTAEVHSVGSADDVAEDLGQTIRTVIDRDVVPPVLESFRSSIRR